MGSLCAIFETSYVSVIFQNLITARISFHVWLTLCCSWGVLPLKRLWWVIQASGTCPGCSPVAPPPPPGLGCSSQVNK